MEVELYISNQPLARRRILSNLHYIIVEKDTNVKGEVEFMMGKEMIVYKQKGLMKYALAGGKNYMSLHVMPIYGFKPLHLRYKTLLPNTNFQKGCINFHKEGDMPLEIIAELISDCSAIDLVKIKDDHLNSIKLK